MSTEKYIPLHILEKITNGFSAHSRIGTGGYGDVYKGVYNGREVAVKLLHVDAAQGIDDQQYINEVGNLLSVNHPNIVQLLGYSCETRSELVVHNGTRRLCQHIYRVLCFEYLQGGSLDKCIYDKSFAPNWSTRYNIIKGICEGLNFLHKCVPQIWHLDLKPANILLDSSLDPKLADFGLSRLFTQLHTHVTEGIIGTWKYMPPEFRKEGKISSKNDVFSLGVVMIEIMTGRPTGYSNSLEMGNVAQLTQKVLTKWSTMIEATSKYQSEELQQVKTCIELAIRCVDSERDIRPSIADILDTLNKTETHIPKKQMADVLLCPTIGPMSIESNPLKFMISELDNITNTHEHCSYMSKDSSSCSVQQVADRETASDVAEEFIIGRTEEKQKILSILSESVTKEMAILPIYGIGGIGKTTLAQLVFNDTKFQGYSRVWIYVSQEFDLNKIGNSIISQLTNKTSNISNKQMLHKRLEELFSGNNILIVLDDLWEQNQKKLVELKVMLSLGLGRKVIIVTTRDEGIARKMCGPAVTSYKLEILTDDMCWTIIKQKSYFEDRRDKKQLEQTGREIATKCGGVALAAQSLGYMLSDMENNGEWESVRDSYIWNLSTSEGPSSGNNEVLESLLLSYSHMSDCLKLCFSYCAVFPKGHNIVKCDLIHQWIALGFTEPFAVFDSMQLCEKYITQLLGMSFLQYSKEPLDKDVILFTMHDLVHDLATEILANKVNEKGNDVGSSCHYALLTDCSKPLQLSLSSPENTRSKIFCNLFQTRTTTENIKALFFLDSGKIELCGRAFLPAKCLHVLDLSECFIRKLPDSIGQLKQLRYLHAPRIGNQKIPHCITELSELNYLNLRGSENISALPKSIGDMKGLMHLDLSGCRSIHELPVSFTELKQLVHLDLSGCAHMSISEEFGGFTKLQYLNLSGSAVRGLPKYIVKLKQLVHLDLSHCYMSMSEEFGVFSELQYLNLSGFRVCSSEQFVGPDKIQFISNGERHIVTCGGLPKIIGNLIKLRYLNLSWCVQNMARSEDQIDSLLGSISTLSNLEHLDLSKNSLPFSIPESIGNLRKLHTLDLSACPLMKLPGSMANMVSLKVLLVDKEVTLDEPTLSRSNFAPLPHFMVHASSDKCSSNISLLQPTNPDKLMIDRLENVKCVKEAQDIKLIEKQKIKELTFQWTVAAERFVDDKEVLEKLVPPSSVKKLSITGYRSISFPDWLMGLWNYLPNLCELDLCDIHKCNNLPPLGQLPNLKQLSVHHMESLEEWSTEYISDEEGANELMFPKLEVLIIYECPKLKLNGNMRQLKQLQKLRLSECRSMTSLPEWLGELSSLKELDISYCKDIRSLPESIQQLTKLEYLKINWCPTLEKWCESKENKRKLAHITEVSPPELRADDLQWDVHPDVVRSVVMNTPGFTEKDLRVALRHFERTYQGFAYTSMHEEHRVLWLRSFLAKCTTKY